MASRRKEHQEDAKLRVMKIIKNNPEMTSREIAQKIGISNGSAYYLLTSLIDKGLLNFQILKKFTKGRLYLPINTKGHSREILTDTSLHYSQKKNMSCLKKSLTN